MAVYAIILNSPDPHWQGVLKKHWENHYILDERVAFVSAGAGTTTKDITEVMGMRGNEGKNVGGIVLQVSYYNGWHDVALWEWLEKNV